ncbi:endo-1,4-beta-xylanase [Ruminococcus sp.]|uniref:endo-1,4-beta-xylanase n=1 Tax=Ruminococcus sp. TaxID=41978 RepID=UPI003F00D552
MSKSITKKLLAGLTSGAMLTTAAAVNLTAVPASAEDTQVIYSTDFEGDSFDFTRRGEDETLELTTEQAHGGSQSLCVSTRAQGWNGPQLALDNLIEANTEYVVTAYAMTPWYATLTLSMQYTDEDGKIHYNNILGQTCDGQWTAYEGVKFSFPAGTTDWYLYFEASDANVNIYLDDFTITAAPEVEIEDIPALVDVYRPYFKIGTAIMASNLSSKPFMGLVEKHFNESITFGNELKPDFVLDKAATLAYMEANDGDQTNPQITLTSAKALLNYCRDNNIPVRGHTLVWHSQTPDWFFKENFSDEGNWVTKEVMIQRMENYIKNVMEALAEQYPTVEFYAWDVVNEAWTDGGQPRTAGSNNVTSGNSAWVQVFGDNSFIEYAFKFARQYAPEGCKLYYNDYNEYIDGKTNAICEMAADLKEKGLIDGIGMQSHLATNFPSAAQYKNALAKFAALGLDIQVTELDITTSDTSQAGLETQAQVYSDIMDALVEYSDSISAVVFWGVTDDQSWRASQVPLLFDKDFMAKPAYYAIVDGLEPVTTAPRETTTTTTITTSGPAENFLAGDADCNGAVEINDVVLLSRYVAEDKEVKISPEGVSNGDYNQDGNVDSTDITAICRLLAHLTDADQ